jgi:hypothetical protein
VLQETEHDVSIEIAPLKTIRFSLKACRRVAYQEPERVPICGDR